MNRRRFIVLLAVAVLASGAVSFVAGRLLAARRERESVSDGWLRGAAAPVRQAERRFEQQAQQLVETVASRKQDLAALLVDPRSPDAAILAQVQRVLASNRALMLAVGGHLIELRDSLPPQAKQRLMNSCVGSLEGRVRRRYRWRGGAGDDAGRRGGGYGRGPGGGFGVGRRRQYRGGRGGEPADKLQLTAEQIAFARQHDPNFSADCARLTGEVAAAYASVLTALEDLRTGESQLLARLDELVDAHGQLELRVARHVILIRPQLSAQQRQRLAGLSRGGSRYPRPARGGSDDPTSTGLLGVGRIFAPIGSASI